MDFKGKVVIITGASSGIGADTAILFAHHSAKVVLVGRNQTNLLDIAKKCEEAKGIKPLVIKADLTIDKEVNDVVTKTEANFGWIDVLVNNAGVGYRGGISDGVDQYDIAMNTNVRSAYLLTSLAVPLLVKSKGVIVNISSIAAFKPIRDLSFLPYSMSKAALDQFTRVLALELGKDGVRVNSVNPGCTKTNFFNSAGFTEEQTVLIYKHRDDILPLGKSAKGEEVANLIVYLASDRACSITGSIFVIDNGESLT